MGLFKTWMLTFDSQKESSKRIRNDKNRLGTKVIASCTVLVLGFLCLFLQFHSSDWEIQRDQMWIYICSVNKASMQTDIFNSLCIVYGYHHTIRAELSSCNENWSLKPKTFIPCLLLILCNPTGHTSWMLCNLLLLSCTESKFLSLLQIYIFPRVYSISLPCIHPLYPNVFFCFYFPFPTFLHNQPTYADKGCLPSKNWSNLSKIWIWLCHSSA